MNMILKVCKLDPPFFTKMELKYFEILSQLWLTKRKTRHLNHSHLFITSSVTSSVDERKTLSWFELCNDWVYKSKNLQMTWYLKATGDNGFYSTSLSWFRDSYYFDRVSFARYIWTIYINYLKIPMLLITNNSQYHGLLFLIFIEWGNFRFHW